MSKMLLENGGVGGDYEINGPDFYYEHFSFHQKESFQKEREILYQAAVSGDGSNHPSSDYIAYLYCFPGKRMHEVCVSYYGVLSGTDLLAIQTKYGRLHLK